MKVIYDISVLGSGSLSNLSRTGVFRVVEEVLFEMLRRENMSLSLAACADIERELSSEKYLEGLNISQKIEWINSYSKKHTLKFYLKHEVKRLKRIYQHSPDNWLLIKREVIRICYKILPTLHSDFSIKDFKKCDIFHSPFIPIKEKIQDLNSLKKFYTIYDFIIIKYPEYFRKNSQQELKKYLYKLNPDNWYFCISESTKHDLLEINQHIDPKKVLVTPLAASNKFFPEKDPGKFSKVKRKYNLPSHFYFLSLCTLEPRKNLSRLIRCFVDLIRSEKINDIKLVLVGSRGWGINEIFDQIKCAKILEDHVVLTGFVDDEDIAVIYSNALAFFYMSFYEGFGLPPLEAMQCGVPVVTSNVSSLPEVVGDAGIMLPPKDEDALKQTMLDIYRNETLRKTYSEKGLLRSKLFSWNKCVDRILEGYRMALS